MPTAVFTVGDEVCVLPPFDVAFPGTFYVESVQDVGGTPVYFVTGVEGGFDAIYLERV